MDAGRLEAARIAFTDAEQDRRRLRPQTAGGEHTSASADGVSSHCSSSTGHRTGRTSAAAASRLSDAVETWNRSAPADGPSPSAPARAADCLSAISPRWQRMGRTRPCKPAKTRSDSASTPLQTQNRHPSRPVSGVIQQGGLADSASPARSVNRCRRCGRPSSNRSISRSRAHDQPAPRRSFDGATHPRRDQAAGDLTGDFADSAEGWRRDGGPRSQALFHRTPVRDRQSMARDMA